KTIKDYAAIHFELISHDGTIRTVGYKYFKVVNQGISEGTFFIEIKQNELETDKTELEIGVFDGKKLIETTRTNFLGPRSFN
ncbi:MAG TPA: hypothetical protein VK476_06870, partial [Flavobacterium sp.]|nr:hypothetical protein [Flavobacterium sp.]